jgi:hypothetical protein
MELIEGSTLRSLLQGAARCHRTPSPLYPAWLGLAVALAGWCTATSSRRTC